MQLLQAQGLSGAGFGPLDIALESGELVSLSGPSGSGKSRLLRALADLDPYSGELSLAGRAANAWPPTEWRRQVGLLPAESHWWADTVVEHFQGAADEAAWALLGLSTEALNWSIARLSSGERQRLALLRLLENRPRVLLLDEPTANLDSDNRDALEALVEAYRAESGAALIWVSHDAAQIERLGGLRLRMSGGRLEAV